MKVTGIHRETVSSRVGRKAGVRLRKHIVITLYMYWFYREPPPAVSRARWVIDCRSHRLRLSFRPCLGVSVSAQRWLSYCTVSTCVCVQLTAITMSNVVSSLSVGNYRFVARVVLQFSVYQWLLITNKIAACIKPLKFISLDRLIESVWSVLHETSLWLTVRLCHAAVSPVLHLSRPILSRPAEAIASYVQQFWCGGVA